MWVSSTHIPGTQDAEAESFLENSKIEHLLVSKNFKYVWKPNIRPFCFPHKLPN